MIKINANRTNDGTILEIEVKGNDVDVGVEAAHIVTDLPEQLFKESPLAFLAMRIWLDTTMKEAEERPKKTIKEGAGNDKCN